MLLSSSHSSRTSIRRPLAICAVVLALAGCASIDAPKFERIETSPAANAVTTAHPLATRAALDVLARGGGPIDAAVAAQMVLGLVEPQSSGIGGGSLVMLWDAQKQQLKSYDGLAAAPAAATAALDIDVDGMKLDRERLRRSGRSVGVPGTVHVLELAHRAHGKLPWSSLFDAAIRLAETGFPISPYMHDILSAPNAARDHPHLRDFYFDGAGRLLPVGTVIRNPFYARTLRQIAARGADAIADEAPAARLVAAASDGYRSTLMTPTDLRAYRARERTPLCAPFLAYRVCTMGPTSFGGVVVLQVLQMLEARAEGRFDFDDPTFVHLYASAGYLAQADRRHHVGDPDFVRVPTDGLIDRNYVRSRARTIDMHAAHPMPKHGSPDGATPPSTTLADDTEQHPATSQIAIADRGGNAISITTTINLNFGSRLVVDGYVLNNALINFASAPPPGSQRANAMAPGKRPVSAMTPTIAFDEHGRPVVVGGAAGGGYIVDYVTRTLVDMLANERTPQQALAAGHVSTANPGKLRLERGTSRANLASTLRTLGHDVEVRPMKSGLAFLKRTPEGWLGAADPRRDGVAEGY